MTFYEQINSTHESLPQMRKDLGVKDFGVKDKVGIQLLTVTLA